MDEVKSISRKMAEMPGLLPRVLRELEIHRGHPRTLLVLSCSFAELLIGTLIEENCKDGKKINDNTRDFPFSVRLTLLHEMGVLHPIHFKRLNWLRKLRNDAAHKPDFRFTRDKVPGWGGDEHKEPERLFSLCVNILCILWNQYHDLFRMRLPIDA